MVGSSTLTAASSFTHAFLYNAGKSDIGIISASSNGPSFSYATGINQIGEISGTSSYTTPVSAGVFAAAHRFLYAYGHMYDLGTNPGFDNWYGYGYAINDHGQVVGFAQDLGGDNVFGFLYGGGVITKISNIIPVSPETPDGVIPEALNNSGVVVGHDPSEPPYGREYGSGFIYHGGVPSDANSLLPANSGWIINDCTGINDYGQICGDGQTQWSVTSVRTDAG